jgi:hypothetical protein
MDRLPQGCLLHVPPAINTLSLSLAFPEGMLSESCENLVSL